MLQLQCICHAKTRKLRLEVSFACDYVMLKFLADLCILICCSIDATKFEDRLGRYVNDEPQRTANCRVKTILVDHGGVKRPHVVLYAKRDIEKGSEIRYDYGGGDLPWRNVRILFPFETFS